MTSYQFKLRKLQTINFYIEGVISLDWTSEEDEISHYIGVIAKNNNMKSALLTTAFPWLMHPDSIKFTEDSIAKGCTNLQVMIEFEWRGYIYIARRQLNSGDDNSTATLLVIDEGGKEKLCINQWDLIFGTPKDIHNHPYCFDSDRLMFSATKAADPSNAEHYSDNLGHKSILLELKELISKADIRIGIEVETKLSGEELIKFQKTKKAVSDLVTEKENADLLIASCKKTNKEMEEKYGNDFTFYQDNLEVIDKAKNASVIARNNYTTFKNNLVKQGIIQQVCFKILENHLKSKYNVEKDTLESLESGKREAVLLFQEVWGNDFLTVDEEKLKQLTNVIETDEIHRLNVFCDSSNSNLETDVSSVYDLYMEKRKKELSYQSVITTGGNTAAATLAKGDFEIWKQAYEGIGTTTESMKEIEKKLKPLKKQKKMFEKSDLAATEIEGLKKKKIFYEFIESSINKTISNYQKECVSRMIIRANQILKDVDPSLKAELKVEENVIVPYLDGNRRDLMETNKENGVSKGTALKINTSIMISRYLEAKSTVPILLDDSMSHVDDSAKGYLERFYNEIKEIDGQMIWLNKVMPDYTGGDLMLINLPNRQNIHNLKKAPWNGDPIKALNATESLKVFEKEKLEDQNEVIE